MFEYILKSAQHLHGWRHRNDQSEQKGVASDQRGSGGQKPKDQLCFVVTIFAGVESSITKYNIIQRGQYRAEQTRICPLGNRHILASSYKDVPSYRSCWLHYYDSRSLMEICAHWGLLLILLAPVWNWQITLNLSRHNWEGIKRRVVWWSGHSILGFLWLTGWYIGSRTQFLNNKD